MNAFKQVEETKPTHKFFRREGLLKEISSEDSFYVVCKTLAHQDHEIAIGASLALGYLKDIRALPYLLRALLTIDAKRAEAVLWALGEIGDSSAVPFLKAALKASFLEKSALLALSKVSLEEAFIEALPRLSHSDELMRIIAVRVLLNQKFMMADLIPTVADLVKDRLVKESSRRVKLMLIVIKNRVDKTID